MAKEKPASAVPEPASGGRLRKFRGWLFASRLRAALSLAGLTVAVIGLATGLTLALRPAAHLTYVQQLAQAFAELEKGNRAAARQHAARLLADKSISYSDHGGAYYILGAVTLQDADEQLHPTKRQLLDLVAARYLEEARSRGLPSTRRAEGMWLLGRSLHDAGRYERSAVILREALEAGSDRPAEIHAMLADCCLRLAPARLAEALDHTQQYLATTGLSASEQDSGRLLAGRILLAQRDLPAAEQIATEIAEDSPAFPEALILRARVLHEGLVFAAEPQEHAAASASMQKRLQELLSRDGLAPSIAGQAQLLIGLFAKAAGDTRAAIQRFDTVRRTTYGQPEALAATVHHADLLLPSNPSEAANLYKRALTQVTDASEAYDNAWLTANEFRTRLSAAIDQLIVRDHFSEALELAEGLSIPFSATVATERQAQIHRAWAEHLEGRSGKERPPGADVLAAEARQHRRQAGHLWRKLADLRITTRHYLDDLGRAADDFRRGHGYQQATAIYGDLLAQTPQQGQPEALLGLGESLLALGQNDAALAALGLCRENFPQHPATYQARLNSSLALQEQGKLTEAQELLIDNLYRFSLTPQSSEWRESLYALGAVQFRHAMELESQSRLAGVDRPDAESRRKGLQFLEQSHSAFEEAIQTLNEAAERYPGTQKAVEARYWIAEAQRHSAKLPRKRLAAISIETSKALLVRQMQEHLQAAVDGYGSLIAQISDQEEQDRGPAEGAILRNCYFSRADALFDLEKFDEAIQAYSAATNRYQHEPEALEAYLQIASCHRRLGRASDARSAVEQARIVLARIRPDAKFLQTTHLARQDWSRLLDWLKAL